MTPQQSNPWSGYARDEDRPLAAYGALIGIYNTIFAGFLLAAHRTGRRLPERLGLGDVLLLTVATYRLSRLVSRDTVTSALHAPFTEYQEPGGSGEINEKPRGKGMRHAIGELVTCPFCMGQWIATLLAFGLVFAPRVTRLIGGIFAAVAFADFLHYGHEAAKHRTEG